MADRSEQRALYARASELLWEAAAERLRGRYFVAVCLEAQAYGCDVRADLIDAHAWKPAHAPPLDLFAEHRARVRGPFITGEAFDELLEAIADPVAA